MKLTLYTDYAMRVLLYLANKNDLATVGEIAEFYQISQNHLVKIVQDLVKFEYIESFKGRGGGMRILKNPEKINLAEFVRHFEPDMKIIDCNSCKIAGSCSFCMPIYEALSAFMMVLNKYSLQDILNSGEILTFDFAKVAK